MSELSAPLTRRGARARQRLPRRGRSRLPVTRLALGAIALLLLGAGVRILVVDTPDGGRPSAEVAINASGGNNSIAGATATMSASDGLTVGPELSPEELSSALAAGPEQSPVSAIAAVPDAAGLVPDLVEETEFGALPRISGSGATPFSAYARPSISPASAGGKALVAVVVTGLGINVTGSLDAIAKLPDTVTLAFAPYGNSLRQTVAAAHAEGHEIFLEVPLEPFDYPENDPGPDTLLTGQAPRDNLNRLYRVMAAFGGYAGLINNMGARFTASSADFGPMMEELGARGLGYLDDGTSNRSVAAQLATANRVPFGRASVMLDASPSRRAILDQLTALEDLARQQGSAIGTISALPISVQTLIEWASDAESRGVLIVPASALMKK